MRKSGQSKRPGHTIADHKFGTGLHHWHAGEVDHDHDCPDEEVGEDHPIWIADHVSLTTVGIDIGSSGTQVIFSRLVLRRLGEDLTSRYRVASREAVFRSPVRLTPYQSDERIDERRLTFIIDEGPHVYVERIVIHGNTDTREEVMSASLPGKNALRSSTIPDSRW